MGRVRDRLKELAGEIAETERRVATTLHAAAVTVAQEGRTEDADRLEGKARAAANWADQEEKESKRP